MLTLVLPGLRFPQMPGFHPFDEISLPALAGMLGRARVGRERGDAECWLYRQFGAESGGAAALTASLDMPDQPTGSWLRADPAHLRVDRDRAILMDADLLVLSQIEADALVASLNHHFADDQLHFHAARPGRWYLRQGAPLTVATTPPQQAAGEDVRAFLPRGVDALQWHRLHNEIQMLLYTHPVNDARELAGQLPVNAIWLWGEGAMPTPHGKPSPQVLADDALVAGMAAAAGCQNAPLPSRYERQAADAMFWLDGLSGATRRRDFMAWRDELVRLERDWFAPLFAAWRDGVVKDVTICLPGDNDTIVATLGREARWKIWRRAANLTRLLGGTA